MVTTIQIKPAPTLQPFMHCYAVRIFNSVTAFPRPQYAQPGYYLSFLLKKDKSCDLTDDSGKFQGKLSNTLCTLFTESQGCVHFKENFFLFKYFRYQRLTMRSNNFEG